MAGGVNVKMGVSGVAQFKQNMKQAQQSVKTLDAQLALTEKEFKANGDAQEYMTKKTAELEAKLQAQKSVVENAERALQAMADKGVDRSSKAYQDLYRQMLSAKGEMLDTESAMNGIADAGSEAADEVGIMNSQIAEVGKGVAFDNVTNGLTAITDGMKKVIKKAWETGEAIVNATLGAGSWADELLTTAAQLSSPEWQVTPEELQRMRKTSTVIDTEVDTIVNARSKLLKGLGNGTKGTIDALDFLRINPDNKEGWDVFWEAGEAIMKLTDEEEQEAKANALFGKSWKDLKPLFAAGRKEYEETMASWSVVENDQIENLGKMDDAYQTMQNEWETFKKEMLTAFSGPLTEGMETITGLFQELNEYLDTPEGQAMLQQIGDTISGLISDLTEINPEDVISNLKGIVDGITDALKWIEEHKNEVVTALEAIGIAFVGLKLATWGINIAKVVSGLGTLLGGGAGAGAAAGAGSGTGAAAAAGAGGGFWTGLTTGLTTKAAGASTLFSMMGNMLPVMGDMFMNQTNAGRGLRDGGGWTGFWGGLQQDAEEAVEGIKENASTFSQDWDENVLTQMGKNSIIFWDEFYKRQREAEKYAEEQEEVIPDLPKSEPTANWEFGEDWSIDEQLEYVNRMTRLAEEQANANKGTTESLPAAVEAAAEKGIAKKPNLIRVFLDGQFIKEYVDQTLGEALAGMYDQ